MTLHEKAQKGLLNGEVLTSELLNEKDKFGNTVWRHAAHRCLKHIPEHLFTNEVLAQKDNFGNTLLQTIASCNTLNAIPQHLLTEDCVSSIWHTAARFKSLKDIPEHLFTEKALNQINEFGETVWHVAAQFKNLSQIPQHLFTKEALYQKDERRLTVWVYLSLYGGLEDVPNHLITEGLLNMKDEYNNYFFKEKDITDIIKLPEKLKDFITSNQNLEKDIIHRDPRLKLIKANRFSLIFKFEGIKDEVIFNSVVTVKDSKFETLCKAVDFIEKNYANIEQSIILPSSENTKIGDLSL